MNFCVATLILKMEGNKQHFGHIMLYYFKKGSKTPLKHTHTKISAVYGAGAMTDQICQKWFVKFRAGNFSLDNVPQSVDQLKLITIKLRH